MPALSIVQNHTRMDDDQSMALRVASHAFVLVAECYCESSQTRGVGAYTAQHAEARSKNGRIGSNGPPWRGSCLNASPTISIWMWRKDLATSGAHSVNAKAT